MVECQSDVNEEINDATKLNDYLCGDLASNGGRQLCAVPKRKGCRTKEEAVANIHHCQQYGDCCSDRLCATPSANDAGAIGVYGTTDLVDDSLN